MERHRNYTNIERRVIGVHRDGQELQQFMSDSPWSAEEVFAQIQEEISKIEELSEGVLTLDESGDDKAGDHSAGTSRQYLGRFGKVDLGQVGVGLGYYKEGSWSMVDAELYLPQDWFSKPKADWHKRLHIPESKTFETKPQIGLNMIRNARNRGLRFEVVSCDCVYGRDSQFRADLNREGFIYMADVPCEQIVYFQRPVVGIPQPTPDKLGRKCSRLRILNQVNPLQVKEVAQFGGLDFIPIMIRHSERGKLIYECATKRIWTIAKDGTILEEWLLIRKEHDGKLSFSLSNAPPETALEKLAKWRSARYFIERIFQDGKSEAGWDEFQAQKYRAWIHHTALVALALWFAAQIKLQWKTAFPRDEALLDQLELDALPALSTANIKEMLRVALPLKQLSAKQAIDLVIKHLVNRSYSTRSRLRAQRKTEGFA